MRDIPKVCWRRIARDDARPTNRTRVMINMNIHRVASFGRIKYLVDCDRDQTDRSWEHVNFGELFWLRQEFDRSVPSLTIAYQLNTNWKSVAISCVLLGWEKRGGDGRSSSFGGINVIILGDFHTRCVTHSRCTRATQKLTPQSAASWLWKICRTLAANLYLHGGKVSHSIPAKIGRSVSLRWSPWIPGHNF